MPVIQSQGLARLRSLLADVDTFATILLVIAVDTFGTECFTWSPQTLAMEFDAEYSVDLPQLNIDKLMALIGVLTTDRFFQSLPAFIRYVNVLADDEFEPSVFNPADVPEMAWAITEVLVLERPAEDEPFCQDICWYIGAKLDDEGFEVAPDILRFALRSSSPATREHFPDFATWTQFSQRQDAQAAQVNELVRDNLQQLLSQLASLPLVSGDTQSLLGHLQR